MKKISIFLSCIMMILLAVSCSDDSKTTISANPDAPVLQAPTFTSPSYDFTAKAYILSSDSAANIVETFTASPANYGADVTVTYTLQIDNSGNNFQNAQSITSSTTPVIPITVAQLNTPIASQGQLAAKPGVISSFDVRIMATIGNAQQVLYSNTVTIGVNPYPTYGILYVPGDYQHTYPGGGDWNPANLYTLLYSPANNGVYGGFLDMSGGSVGFKFNEYPDWDHGDYCWGVGSQSGTLDTQGGNITTDPGYYMISVDTKALTFTMTEITQWGIIGDFNGWAGDVLMTLDPTTKLWTASVTFSSDGGFKIRANGAWDIAFGIDDQENYTTVNANNISVKAGTYTVTMDLTQWNGPGYSITLQ